MEEEIRNIDEYSGNPIRLTDNGYRDDDILAPQDPRVLELDPDTKLPIWWEEIKAKRGDV